MRKGLSGRRSFLILVDTVDGLWHVVDLLLGGIDHAADHDDLFGRVVLEDEGESAIGLDHVLLSLLTLLSFEVTTTTEHARVLLEHILGFEIALTLLVLLLMTTSVRFVLIFFAFLLVASDGRDSLFGDLDGALMDELVQMDLGLAGLGFVLGSVLAERITSVRIVGAVSLFLRFVLVRTDTLFGHSREIGPQRIEHIGDALFAQRTTHIDLMFDLEFGQLNVNATMRMLVGLLQ